MLSLKDVPCYFFNVLKEDVIDLNIDRDNKKKYAKIGAKLGYGVLQNEVEKKEFIGRPQFYETRQMMMIMII